MAVFIHAVYMWAIVMRDGCGEGADDSMMNRFERLGSLTTVAKVRYLDAEFQVVSPGDHVVCAVTGEKIPLDLLTYWCVDRQEPYASAKAGLDRLLEVRAKGEVQE